MCLPPYKHFLQSLKIQSKVWGFTVVVLALLKTYSLVWKVWQRHTALILFKTSNIKVENRHFLQLIHTPLHILSSFYTHSFTHTHTHTHTRALFTHSLTLMHILSSFQTHAYTHFYFLTHSFFLSNTYLHTLSSFHAHAHAHTPTHTTHKHTHTRTCCHFYLFIVCFHPFIQTLFHSLSFIYRLGQIFNSFYTPTFFIWARIHTPNLPINTNTNTRTLSNSFFFSQN